ncbi:hypothetical protein H8D64_00420 [PVC group bacterium]|nr:hypothetical protein [PVC group bacterium]
MRNSFFTPSVFFEFARYALRYLLRRRYKRPENHSSIQNDFFGICVASSEDPACNDYVLKRLEELNLRCVRLDFSSESEGTYIERFLERLIDGGFRVCLHLMQPFAEAQLMQEASAQDRWRKFVTRILERWGDKLDMVEIGSTINRRKWSGYTVLSFMKAWDIAAAVAATRKIKLAGPNVTDYEPQYNVGFLGMMRSRKTLPDVHTDNLFVERHTEPETYDHKILGHFLAPFIKYDFLKKAKVMANISEYFGISETVVSHVAWSRRRISRNFKDFENKQADYLSRYLCLALVSGYIDRVYWGPLIGQREGPIDDGTDFYPDVQHVTFYGKANGEVENYRIRPAFKAYQTIIRLLDGAEYIRPMIAKSGLYIYEFKTLESRIHVAWTQNGFSVRTSDCYTEEILNSAKATLRDGEQTESIPPFICESPVYLQWPLNTDACVNSNAACLPNNRIFPGKT